MNSVANSNAMFKYQLNWDKYTNAICTTVFIIAMGCDSRVPSTHRASSDTAELTQVQDSFASTPAGRKPSASEQSDVAWAELTSSGPAPQPVKGEDPFIYFMRDVEVSKQRRRELGLKFWSEHRNDPRRYKWLLLATHLAPYYAKDIYEWAENEAKSGPNMAAVDVSALAAWNSAYPDLKAEFWAAEEVTDSQRRYLWYGQLKQQLVALRQAAERGELVDANSVLADIVEYADAFPQPLSEQDRETFDGAISDLTGLIIDNADAYRLNKIERVAFHKEMVGGVFKNVESKDINEMRWQEFTERGFNDAGRELTAAQRAWRTLPAGRWFDGRPIPQIPNPPHGIDEGDIVFAHDLEIMARQYRALGLRLWQSDIDPDPVERMFWLVQTLQLRPFYMDRITEGARARGLYWSDADFDIDKTEHAEWDRIYPTLRMSLWNSPAITSEYRGELRFQELRNALSDIRSGRPSQIALADALDGVHELWTEYGYWYQSRRLASSYVVRVPDELGMTAGDLASFLKPMLLYEDEGLRNLAEGWFRSQELRTTPLEFSAAMLSGEHFDLAELRGNIVLMDYWTTTCSSCIAAMPLIHRIYEDYQDRGFEVVSVNFDADRNRRKVERIELEPGLTWTTLNAEDLWAETNARFGWGNILPAYMLLDREGKLVAGTEEVDYGRNLRALLDEMLTAEAADKEAVTAH